jgi:transposase
MRLPPVAISEADRTVLERRARSKTASQRDVARARVILMAADGAPNTAIEQAVGINKWQVGRWRKRYEAEGLEGLKDRPRSGRPLVYGHDDHLKIVKTICEIPPAPATRWTMDAVSKALADDVGISASQIHRICVSLDLKPWQVRSWMTSHDPDLWAKAADVCGLYLSPPENAVVYSIDEKSGMQAKSRANPTKPAIPGVAARQEFEYVRHGTAVLFAALDVHDGGVDGWITDSTRADNFISFLSDLVTTTPKGFELHCIVDNLSAHSTRAVEDFLDDPKHHHVFLHNTPTHASWLNQVELFLSIVSRDLCCWNDGGRIAHPGLASNDAVIVRSGLRSKDRRRRQGPTSSVVDRIVRHGGLCDRS